MKKRHLAGLVAIGIGAALPNNINAEVTANPLTNEVVFGIQPRLIEQSICEAHVLSVKNIQQMVEARNCRDANIVASTADEMTHL